MSDSIDVPCPSCGETTAADCHVKCRSCGYETPGMRRVAAIKANPAAPNTEIAKDLGESEGTIRLERERLRKNNEVPEGRTGRAAPRPKKKLVPAVEPHENPHIQAVLDFEHGPIAWKNRAESAAVMADYAPLDTMPTTKSMLKAVDRVIERWTALKLTLERKLNHEQA